MPTSDQQQARLDTTDKRILRALQHDASLSLDTLAERVALSRNACWRRVKALEKSGVISKRVTILNPDALGCGLTVLIAIRTREHAADWLKRFREAVSQYPEIVAVWRTSGDIDYLLKAQVADMRAYDALYQRLIEAVPLSDVSASFVMEAIKDTTELPVS
ncbi:MAG: Lrp/AsnC family transcriptional regulator [Pseudomonadota bacterium]